MKIEPNLDILERFFYPILRNIYVGKPDRAALKRLHEG